MNTDWRAFLESRSATVEETGELAGSARFAGTPTDADYALMDLSHLGLIAVGGPEAADFLQGQVSNDVRELSDSHSHLSSHCSAKGRMLANFRALRVEDSIFLVLPRSQMGALLKRLRMFMLRARVSIDDASDALVCFGMVGQCADPALGAMFGVSGCRASWETRPQCQSWHTMRPPAACTALVTSRQPTTCASVKMPGVSA